MIPVDAAGRPLPIEPDDAAPERPASAPLLADVAREQGWCPAVSPAGSPGWRVPGGGLLSFEPGGQIEYSSPPFDGVDRLVEHVEAVFSRVDARAAERGIGLLARGIDPRTPFDEAPLRLAAERYRRMSDHYDRRGPAGRRMMRQTAALHLNVDVGPDLVTGWAVANKLAPALIALFANSPEADGRESGHRSVRAAQWRALDPSRTGVRTPGGDPTDRRAAVEDYLRFAVEADAFLLGPPGLAARPWRGWPEGSLTLADFDVHLSTLFPEVRPRGYLELRSVDALPLAWYGAPLALVAGVLQDPATRLDALDALPEVDHDALVRAGREGLADAGVRRSAELALDLAESGLRRVGGAERSAEVLRDYRARFAARGLDHGHAGATLLTPR